MTAPAKTMVGGIFWMTATKGAAQAISWLITIVVLRLLAPQDYGLMGMALLFSGFTFLFNELGLGAAIIQKPDLDDDQLSSLRWIISTLNVGLFFAVFLGAPLVAAYFREPRIVPIVRALSAMFLINALGAPSSYLLQRRMAFRQKAAAEFSGSMTGALTTVGLAASGFGVWSLVGGTLVQQLTMHGLYCFHAPVPIRWRFSWNGLTESFSFGWKVAASRLLWWLASNADYMVVGRVLGPVQLGFYSLAFQFSSVPIDKLVAIVNQVAFPSFSALQSDDDTTRRHYLKVVSTVALITFPMFVGMFLVADAAVELLLTAKWQPVIVPLKILSLVACLRAIEILNTPVVVARGQPQIVLVNSLVQVAILPPAVYLGAQAGLLGVALAWLLSRPIFFVLITRRALKVIGLPLGRYLGALKHAVAGCLLMAGAVLPVQHQLLAGMSPAVIVAATCSLGFLVYLGYQVAFNPDALTEGLALLRARRPLARGSQAAALESNAGVVFSEESLSTRS